MSLALDDRACAGAPMLNDLHASDWPSGSDPWTLHPGMGTAPRTGAVFTFPDDDAFMTAKYRNPGSVVSMITRHLWDSVAIRMITGIVTVSIAQPQQGVYDAAANPERIPRDFGIVSIHEMLGAIPAGQPIEEAPTPALPEDHPFGDLRGALDLAALNRMYAVHLVAEDREEIEIDFDPSDYPVFR